MLRSSDFSKNCNSCSILSPSEGMLKAISNAMVSMVSESPAKTSRTLYKEQRKIREGR